MPFDNQAATVCDQVGAFFYAEVDIATYFVMVNAGYQRAHVIRGIGTRPNFETRDLGLQLADHRICNFVANTNRDRNCHTALATRPERRTHKRVNRIVDVCIRHNDGVVLCATQCLHALAVLCSRAVDVLGDRC